MTSLFARPRGRHVRSSQSWGALAHAVADASRHPVVDLATACPALLRRTPTR